MNWHINIIPIKERDRKKGKIFLLQKLKVDGQKDRADIWVCTGILRFNVKSF